MQTIRFLLTLFPDGLLPFQPARNLLPPATIRPGPSGSPSRPPSAAQVAASLRHRSRAPGRMATASCWAAGPITIGPRIYPVIHLAVSANVLYASADSGFRTLDDVLAKARTGAGYMSAAHAGIGNPPSQLARARRPQAPRPEAHRPPAHVAREPARGCAAGRGIQPVQHLEPGHADARDPVAPADLEADAGMAITQEPVETAVCLAR